MRNEDPVMAPETEKREFTRVPLTFEVQVTVAGQSVAEGRIRDLSLKGMLVQTGQSFETGLPCEAVIRLAEGQVEIHASGVVAVRHPDGFAMEFTSINGLDSYIHLRNLVLFNSQDADQVDREIQSHAGIKRKD